MVCHFQSQNPLLPHNSPSTVFTKAGLRRYVHALVMLQQPSPYAMLVELVELVREHAVDFGSVFLVLAVKVRGTAKKRRLPTVCENLSVHEGGSRASHRRQKLYSATLICYDGSDRTRVLGCGEPSTVGRVHRKTPIRTDAAVAKRPHD